MKIINLTPLVFIETLDSDLIENLNLLRSAFGKVIVLIPEGGESKQLPQIKQIYRIRYNGDEGKAAALNKGIAHINTPYFVYLYGCERINFDDLTRLDLQPQRKRVICAQITCNTGEESYSKKYLQPRIIPVEKNVFKGFALPDIEESFNKYKWNYSNTVININRKTDLIGNEDIATESDLNIQTRQSIFWNALDHADKGEFAKSAKKLMQLVKKPSGFKHQQLAELNGLAYALKELKDWQTSAKYAKKSMAINEQQKAPYLILFEMYFARGNWEEAYTCLNKYSQYANSNINSTTDVFLEVPDFHFLLAECAFKMHHFEKAFNHYQKYYKLKNGKVSEEVLEKLFIYSIDLEDYENSVRYFYRLFEKNFFSLQDEVKSVKMFESLSLFIDNGWHQFVCEVYEELHEYHPDDHRILQGWIASLVKAKKLEQAQALLPFAKKNKKAASTA